MELIECLEKATQADLADLDQKIAAATANLETMKTLRHVLDVRLNGPKTKKQRTKAKTDVPLADNEPAVVTIMKYLDHAGPTSQGVLGEQVHLSRPTLAEIIQRHAPCFKIEKKGLHKMISLSEAGKKSLAEDREMANVR